jgi:hypothetical protein
MKTVSAKTNLCVQCACVDLVSNVYCALYSYSYSSLTRSILITALLSHHQSLPWSLPVVRSLATIVICTIAPCSRLRLTLETPLAWIGTRSSPPL